MPHFAQQEVDMRLPEDEPFYTRRNLWGAIERHIKERTPAELAPATRAGLVQQVAAQAPAETYLAGGQITVESLASLIDEVIAELTREEDTGRGLTGFINSGQTSICPHILPG